MYKDNTMTTQPWEKEFVKTFGFFFNETVKFDREMVDDIKSFISSTLSKEREYTKEKIFAILDSNEDSKMQSLQIRKILE